MSRKVLIIGHNYYNFLSAVREAFTELGWEAVVSGYDNPVHPYTRLMKIRYKLSRHRDRLHEESMDRFSKEALERFRAVQPDLVFIMNGDMLRPHVLDAFRESARVALWLYDNTQRIPKAIGHADHVDALFCFDQADVDWYAAHGKKARFLPQACDTQVYHPLEGSKDIDILFIGGMYHSPRRRELLNAVIDAFPGRRIEVYGWYYPWFKGLWGWITRPHKGVFKNHNVSPVEANVLYNRARVALNIHQELQRDGANPRVFEICGAGTYQICDRNPYIESLFPDGEVGLYGSEQELIDLISMALSSDMSAAAARAYDEVVTHHSYRARMAEVLSVLGL